MSVSKQELLSRLEVQAPPAILGRVRLLLKSSSHGPGELIPVRIKAAEALRIWETRLETARLPETPTRGIEALVGKLRQMPPEAEIEQFGFSSKAIAGSIFFNRQSGEFMGETIVAIADKPKRFEPKRTDGLSGGNASSRRRGESA